MNLDLGAPGNVADLQVAAVAAAAARATAGVARLQPSVWGLVQQVSRDLWERVTGQPYPDLGGVEVELRDDAAWIDLTLVTTGTWPAAAIAAAVQRAVTEAVIYQNGIPVTAVAVHVCEISVPR